MGDSLVLQLQRDAMEPNTRVSDLLRKSLVVASKLEIADFGRWAQQELNGYIGQKEAPPYRVADLEET